MRCEVEWIPPLVALDKTTKVNKSQNTECENHKMDLSQITRILLCLSVLQGNHGAENSTKDQIKNYSSLDTPFRSQKVNLLWTKAR